jgi:4-hydroxybenzoate polyprenyltransferase
MTIYDLWGKSTWPLLTDFAQGLSWGCLGLWAALVVGGQATPLTGVLFAYVVVYILLISGVHGGLRDLPNDSRYGVRSTAVFFGARVEGEGVVIPQRLRRYSRFLQGLLLVIVCWPLIGNWFGYRPLVWAITIAAEIALAFFCWRWLNQAIATAAHRSQMLAHGALHLIASFAALIALFLGYLTVEMAVVIGLLFVGPLLTHAWIRSAIRWRAGRSSTPPTFSTPSER